MIDSDMARERRDDEAAEWRVMVQEAMIAKGRAWLVAKAQEVLGDAWPGWSSAEGTSVEGTPPTLEELAEVVIEEGDQSLIELAEEAGIFDHDQARE